ncbi:MAG TPA: YcjF family protein, partial [Acetobacteraceae bacterium]
ETSDTAPWNPGEVENFAPNNPSLNWIVGGLLFLIGSGLALSMIGFAADQFNRSSILGALTIVAYSLAAAAIVHGIRIEVRSYRRLTVVDQWRSKLQDPRCPVDEARLIAQAWLDTIDYHAISPKITHTALKACVSPEEVRATLRHHALEPLRERAQHIARKAGMQGGALVAITPSPALDALIAGLQSLKLIREIGQLYGLRPSASVTMGLMRRAAFTAAGVSGIDLAANAAAEHLFSNAPGIKHLVSASPGAGVAARRLYSFGQAVAEACSLLPSIRPSQ